jgi:hypothetical protein
VIDEQFTLKIMSSDGKALKVPCPCGENINLGGDYNPQAFTLLPECRIEPFVDAIMSEVRSTTDQRKIERAIYFLLRLYKPLLPRILECPNCGTLVIFPDGDYVTWPPMIYRRDESTTDNRKLSDLQTKEVFHLP